MKNISINNIIKLIKKFYIECWKLELITLAIYFLAFFLMMYIAAITSVGLFYSNLISVYIAILILTTFSFRVLGNKTSAMMFLTLPASTADKVISNIVIYIFIKPLTIYFVCFIGLFLVTILPAPNSFTEKNDLFNEFAKVFYYPAIDNICNVLSFILLQSMMFFGSVYFKKAALGKILLVVLLLSTVFIIVNLICYFLFVPEISNNYNIQNYYLDQNISSGTTVLIWSIVFAVLLMFFLFLSYIRLRETEV